MPWSERNTHHWHDWSLADLVAAKQGQRVSLVVPARNEAATVGNLVSKLRTTLMETSDLVDELVVIDSDSSDETARIASEAGAAVFASAAIRPDLGTYPGKGEAMWKSQFVTTGELIVFMDADLTDWDTHFVRGLLGPLVNNPTIELVKGFYHRPGEHGLDGGRVTELVARPLLALHRPPLRDLIQPLAGEWSIRRSLFERLSVPTGYGVELAALVDTLDTRGMDAIAQVDLGRRDHSHQGLFDLGLMATQIVGMMSRRLGTGPAGDEVGLRQYVPIDGSTKTVERTVSLLERAPLPTASASDMVG
ncbi:glucosyl-3-phosphoglycerate synthase [Nocardioides albertanoniae]|uniref:Glucosyl-3-phosphoglycerate synthase n=1 Tax=Nocardioides albertanoniae TaxID=1175486 RepID=A0A543A8W9_9ACTN|nr:glucosyl-3-phosphoglycerate synthase [Nocardioides albertanoniae]TQL69048.1 glucosyl-3-phosphoglycerate synthase [Nocardioides albertanoniae]